MNFMIYKMRNFILILKNRTGLDKKLVIDIFFSYVLITLKQLFLVKISRLSIRSEKIFGKKLTFFNYNDFATLFEEIFIHGDYFFKTEKEGPVILDCGSNIGLSVIYFKMLYPQSKITAFEAHGPTFTLLKNNILSNNITGVKFVNRALYSVAGKKIWFYSNSLEPGALGMTLIAKKPGHDKKESVLSGTLSSYIKSDIDFIKMDIEGAEMEVIPELFKKGRQKFLKLLIVEYHHHVDLSKDRLGEILCLFEKNGFGYNISTWAKPPFRIGMGQDMLIFFYLKKTALNS